MTKRSIVRRAWLVATACLLSGYAGYAQTPTFDRATTCTASPEGYGWGPKQLAVDGQGNSFVAGQFSGTVQIGSTLLTSAGVSPGYPNVPPPDVFVAKLDAAGSYVWATQLTGTLWEDVTSLAVDAAGDVYVAGYFESYSVAFGNITLFNSSAASELYVAKLSGTTGQWLWAKRCGGIGRDNSAFVAVNTLGEVCLAGFMEGGPTDYGPYTLPASGGPYLFLAKLSASGTWLMAQQTATGGGPSLSGMLLDAQNNFYLVGSFNSTFNSGVWGTLTIGTTTLTTSPPYTATTYPDGPGTDLFVAKYTAAGTPLWAVQADPNGRNMIDASGLALDGIGHLYVAGGYRWSSIRIGTTALQNLSPVSQAPQAPIGQVYYSPNAYVARLNTATGAWEWAMRAGGTPGDYITRLAADSQGRVYVVGGTYNGFTNPLPGGGQVDLAQLDGATGAWRWTRARVPRLEIKQLALDGAGRVTLVGQFKGPTATFGPVTLAQAGGATGATGFVARLGAGPLAAHAATAPAVRLEVWPNPARFGTIRVQGPRPGELVQVLDVLGRPVGQGRVPASGVLELGLPPSLAAGLYLVRGAGQARQLVVE